jgi:hypothetical protein
MPVMCRGKLDLPPTISITANISLLWVSGVDGNDFDAVPWVGLYIEILLVDVLDSPTITVFRVLDNVPLRRDRG